MNIDSPAPVLITGGARRIGRALALHLANKGHPIAIHYNRSQEAAGKLVDELQGRGVRAAAFQADFAEDFDADRLLAEADAAIGGVRLLINNAAIFEKDTLDRLSHARFHTHIQTNLYAPLALIRAFAARDFADDGHIINLADGTFGWSLSAKFLSYALSKHGLMNATEMLSRELAPRIRINAIGLAPSLPGEADPPGLFERHATRAPTGVVSSPEEICRTVDYLLAAPNVTGQTIFLSGGLHCR